MIADIEINIAGGTPSVKVNGKEMNGLINELNLNIKPMELPTLTIKMAPESLKVCGDVLLIPKENEPQEQETKEKTLVDVKRHFQKMLQLLETIESSETPSPFRKDNT